MTWPLVVCSVAFINSDNGSKAGQDYLGRRQGLLLRQEQRDRTSDGPFRVGASTARDGHLASRPAIHFHHPLQRRQTFRSCQRHSASSLQLGWVKLISLAVGCKQSEQNCKASIDQIKRSGTECYQAHAGRSNRDWRWGIQKRKRPVGHSRRWQRQRHHHFTGQLKIGKVNWQWDENRDENSRLLADAPKSRLKFQLTSLSAYGDCRSLPERPARPRIFDFMTAPTTSTSSSILGLQVCRCW